MEPGYIVEQLALPWQNELNLADNMKNIVDEFKNERNLLPIHIIIHGPPAIGKTRLAKKLCDYYGGHYVSVKVMIEETINELVSFARIPVKIFCFISNIFRKRKLKKRKTK